MTIALKTATETAELYLIDEGAIIATHKWQAHRQLADTLHSVIAQQLHRHGKDWQDIAAIIVFSGPGSFTGLRIGISVTNTLAYTLKIPIVGVGGEQWVQHGIDLLQKDVNHITVLPKYGQLPNTTTPKK